ncbi:hypothetical protein Mgra_00008477 [Meloidogyne graminicola]|uniref:Probable inactive acireductone dioxygenase n=1 Tax=Meloidogyne graminicola TaxID=189291 RepID=A0A8S9ZFL0_9BILA|nr:hypothetical protein Mgra_00008477 [Meloidogyne graminicola]
MSDNVVDKHEKCHRNPPVFVGPRALHKLGIQYFYVKFLSLFFLQNLCLFQIPVENSEKGLASIAASRCCNYKDEVVITKETMSDYEDWLKRFFEEHFHPEDAIRYVVEGSGFFDVRTPEDRWIRIVGEPGDLLIIPAGIFHRFTVTKKGYIKAIRLYKDSPKWVAHNRKDPKTERMEIRKKYLSEINKYINQEVLTTIY